jgi:hypothetical protein
MKSVHHGISCIETTVQIHGAHYGLNCGSFGLRRQLERLAGVLENFIFQVEIIEHVGEALVARPNLHLLAGLA